MLLDTGVKRFSIVVISLSESAAGAQSFWRPGSALSRRIATLLVSKKLDSFRLVSSIDLVEEGIAALHPINRNLWTYTATQTNAARAGSVISCTATDLPGNKASLDLVV